MAKGPLADALWYTARDVMLHLIRSGELPGHTAKSRAGSTG
jgi:hypothetical protein